MHTYRFSGPARHVRRWRDVLAGLTGTRPAPLSVQGGRASFRAALTAAQWGRALPHWGRRINQMDVAIWR